MSIHCRSGGRAWYLYDQSGDLVCVTLYKRGALEVAKRLGYGPESVTITRER